MQPDDTAYCGNCGTRIGASARFCASCDASAIPGSDGGFRVFAYKDGLPGYAFGAFHGDAGGGSVFAKFLVLGAVAGAGGGALAASQPALTTTTAPILTPITEDI